MGVTRRTLLVSGTIGLGVGSSGCLGGDSEADDDSRDDELADDSMGGNSDSEYGMNEPTDDEIEADATVRVGRGNGVSFEPDTLVIDAGQTVEFVWESNGHNIIVTSQPVRSGWDGVSSLENEGYRYYHTFAVEGRYEYLCGPHEHAGMIGTIDVGNVGIGIQDDDTLSDDMGVPGPGYGY